MSSCAWGGGAPRKGSVGTASRGDAPRFPGLRDPHARARAGWPAGGRAGGAPATVDGMRRPCAPGASHWGVVTLQPPSLRCARPRVPTALSPAGSRLCRAAVLALPLPLLIPSSPPSRNASAQGLPYATLLSPCAFPSLRGTLTSVICLKYCFV